MALRGSSPARVCADQREALRRPTGGVWGYGKRVRSASIPRRCKWWSVADRGDQRGASKSKAEASGGGRGPAELKRQEAKHRNPTALEANRWKVRGTIRVGSEAAARQGRSPGGRGGGEGVVHYLRAAPAFVSPTRPAGASALRKYSRPRSNPIMIINSLAPVTRS